MNFGERIGASIIDGAVWGAVGAIAAWALQGPILFETAAVCMGTAGVIHALARSVFEELTASFLGVGVGVAVSWFWLGLPLEPIPILMLVGASAAVALVASYMFTASQGSRA